MSTCPGCGLTLPNIGDLPDSPFRAPRECWALYGRLSARTLALPRETFIHQTAIDCYEAQHPGLPGKPIAAVFGLVGLYLVVEKGYTGLEVQHVHMMLGNEKRPLPSLSIPDTRSAITVASIGEVTDANLPVALTNWAHAIWDAWAGEQDKIRLYTAPYI